jgi:hypothetical protein
MRADVNYEFVDDVLRTRGKLPSKLLALEPGDELISVSILQPAGDVAAREDYIGPANRDLALQKLKVFLESAVQQGSDIALTPEYFCPWSIFDFITQETGPPQGKLWVLCFESITVESLLRLTQIYSNFEWIYNLPQDRSKKFLNSLVYLFRAEDFDGTERIICLVQFKNQAMVELTSNIERRHLICGDSVFIFRNDVYGAHLVSLICSDALDFNPHTIARSGTDRVGPWDTLPFIVLHPQLNKKPTYDQFREYRRIWGMHHSNATKLIVCANWSKETTFNNQVQSSDSFGRSAIYLREPAKSVPDAEISQSRGLYFVAFADRTNAFYFNFSEHIFTFTVSRPDRSNIVRAAAAFVVPHATKVAHWENNEWQDCTPDSGYNILCRWKRTYAPYEPLTSSRSYSDLQKEKVINRAAGLLSGNTFFELDSVLVTESEVIRRLTFAQDMSEQAVEFREQVLGKLDQLCTILSNGPLPTNIAHMDNPQLGDWGRGFNLSSSEYRAFVAMVGDCSSETAQAKLEKMKLLVGEQNARSVVVFYRDQGQLKANFYKDSDVSKPNQSASYIAKEF